MKFFSLAVAIWLLGVHSLPAKAATFSIRKVAIDSTGVFSVELPNLTPESYYRLVRRGGVGAVDVVMPRKGETSLVLRDSDAGDSSRAFYHAEEIPITSPLDSDGDGIDDFFELTHPLILNPLVADDAGEDADGDGDSNLDEYLAETDPADVTITAVSFVTSDGITIRGELRVPAAQAGTQLPAVVFIHQGFRTRGEWDRFLPAFSDAGYSTLAYDIRGHGASGGSFSSADFDNPDTSPKDVVAALEFVRGLPQINSDRIGVVGSSVGGNLACVASQKRWVKTAVNISGKTSAVRNLAAESDLDLESMFHIASSGDGGGQRATWANELHGFTSGARQVEVVDGSSAHGVAVFDADPTLLGRIVGWLAETL